MLNRIDHCNVEEMLKVKAKILAEPENLDMRRFCGTARCIAGHAGGWDKVELYYLTDYPDIAAEKLGLSAETANMLFFGRVVPFSAVGCVSLFAINAAQAAKAIDNVIEFNDPRWAEVMEE